MSTSDIEPIEKGKTIKLHQHFSEVEVQKCREFFSLEDLPRPLELILVGAILAGLQQKLAGSGARSVSHLFEYLAPVAIGDELEILLQVEKVETAKSLLTIKVDATNQNYDQVLTGRAVLLFNRTNHVPTLE